MSFFINYLATFVLEIAFLKMCDKAAMYTILAFKQCHNLIKSYGNI